MDSTLEMGVVIPSTSPYSSPNVMVEKKDGSNRVWVDFRKLKKITEVNPEPMTTAEDLFHQLSGKKYLSKIDLPKDTGRYRLHQRMCTKRRLLLQMENMSFYGSHLEWRAQEVLLPRE